jgi:hypothetical protein
MKCGASRVVPPVAIICFAVGSLAFGSMALISCGAVVGNGTITPPATVSVNPGLASLFANEAGNSWPAGANQQQFTATVSGSTSQSVTWSVTGGKVNGTVDPTGLYTAPEVVPNPPTATITATAASATVPGSAFVTLSPATSVGTSQITVTATAAGAAHQNVVTLIVH